ncbi:MAG: PKD domain-containing protein [Sphingobacteriales bacterium]|nr:PKD domain-containing protein [Sphingobacteriales bacterium]
MVYNPKDLYNQHVKEHEGTAQRSDVWHLHAFKMNFIGAAANPVLIPNSKKKEYHNYFIGNKPAQWATDVAVYGGIEYQQLYKGIDVRIYGNKNEQMKYDYIVDPHADATQIRWQYEGVENICIKNDEIYLSTSLGESIEAAPLAYQWINGIKKIVPCRYQLLADEQLTFDFPEGYNTNYELVIDPELIASTYSGTSETVYGHTATYDAQGHLYGGGRCFGTGYPVTTGAIQTTFAGSVDNCISKYTPDGNTLMFATYIGGNNEDIPHSLVVTDFDELVVMASTYSSDFPVSAAAFDDTYNGGRDLTITIIKSSGNSLIGSTYIGGGDTDGENAYNVFYEDSYRGEVIAATENGSSNIYVVSSTNSDNFPVTSAAYQSNLQGDADAVVFKLNGNASQLLWSTYFGGNNADSGFSIRLDSNGNVFAAGATSGGLTTNNASVQPNFAGGAMGGWGASLEADGFIAKFNPAGSNLLRCTYIGTSEFDQGYFIDINPEDDDIYIFGLSAGDFPVSSNVYSNANGEMFIAKLNNNLSSYYWTTRLGSNDDFPEIAPTAFRVDICGNIYAGGYTLSGNNFPITPDAFQNSLNDNTGDYYFMVLEKDAATLSYATYFGGNGYEHVDGGTSRFDNKGVIYQAVCTNSSDFYTTSGAFDNNLSTGWDLFVFKFDFEKGIVAANPSVDASLVVEYDEGCAPLTVFFYQQLDTATTTQYYWNFGDGDSSDLKNPLHTFLTPGDYQVRLVVVDSTTCNITDTAYVAINVGYSEIEAEFAYDIAPPCDNGGGSYEVQFFNNTIGTPDVNLWEFGNIPFPIQNNNDTISFTYPQAGTYTVRLITIDSLPCLVSDTSEVTFTLQPPTYIAADFSLPAGDCVPFDLEVFSSNAAAQYQWLFGDGASGNDSTALHQYTQAGTYEVSLIVQDASTCNESDTLTLPLEVYAVPQSLFSTDKDSIFLGSSTLFTFTGETNGETLQYDWDLGDGSIAATTDNFTHTYTAIGTYNICLTVTSPHNCTDAYCKEIDVYTDKGFIGIPNAFTPNDDKVNDAVQVEGKNIVSFTLKIFNRWGKLLFETDNIDTAWDGNYQGDPQEADVYVYTLEAKMIDGEQISKTGNITLLR